MPKTAAGLPGTRKRLVQWPTIRPGPGCMGMGAWPEALNGHVLSMIHYHGVLTRSSTSSVSLLPTQATALSPSNLQIRRPPIPLVVGHSPAVRGVKPPPDAYESHISSFLSSNTVHRDPSSRRSPPGPGCIRIDLAGLGRLRRLCAALRQLSNHPELHLRRSNGPLPSLSPLAAKR